ncbi:MAG: hypothetical protein NTZ46_07695 [Verrucomicrobia bacterium]|nr:hypothetical protein [Verrucomicrobiota bacterium]
MLIHKITEGHVVQIFDTQLGRFISQAFVASGRCAYEDESGRPVDPKVMGDPEPYSPYDMAPPQNATSEPEADGSP